MQKYKEITLYAMDSGYTTKALTEEYGQEKFIQKAFSTLQEAIKYIEENL